MNAKKQRDQNRRRASKLACQAWDAADEQRFGLAVKIIGRAVDLNPGNPVLWHDQGMLLLQLREDEQAARSFQAAIQAAPEFAEGYASLAAIRAGQERLEQAVTLQREAVRLAPQTDRYQSALTAYEVLLAGGCNSDVARDSQPRMPLTENLIEDALNQGLANLAARIERLDWPEIEKRLTAQGFALVPKLLGAEACQTRYAMGVPFHEFR